MKRTVFALLLVIAAASCERPGPLPEVHDSYSAPENRQDWFPSASNEPFPLDLAIRGDRVDEVRRLLASGADPNTRWSQSGDRFPMREALDTEGRDASNQTEIVRLLLQHGADANAKWCPLGTRDAWSEWGSVARCQSSKGMTPLVFATMRSQREIVDLLLQAGADPKAENWNLQSALDYATDDIVFELIARRQFPDLESRDSNALAWLDRHNQPRTPAERTTPLTRALLHMRFDEGDTIESRGRLRIVLSLEPNLNETTGDGRTPLSIAMQTSIAATNLLLQHGANVNQRWCPVDDRARVEERTCSPDKEITPLMWAAKSGNFELVRMLLEFDANPFLYDSERRIAWHYASTRDVWELLKVR